MANGHKGTHVAGMAEHGTRQTLQTLYERTDENIASTPIQTARENGSILYMLSEVKYINNINFPCFFFTF